MRLPLRLALTAGLALAAAGAAEAQPAAEPATGAATFNIFLRSTPIGLEQTVVSRSDDGWVIRSTGQLAAPIDHRILVFEAAYDDAWRPRRLTIESTRGGTPLSARTTFAAGRADSELVEGTRRINRADPVAADAVVLPDLVFAAYEALAVRLAGAAAGDEIPIYVAPRGQITARVDSITTQEVRTAERTLTAAIHRLTFNDAQLRTAEVWSDERRRLLRVSLPALALEIARQDVVRVSSRVGGTHLPGDEVVRVGASGFSLAATVTTPVGRDAPPAGWPAVVLVPGATSAGRDGTLSGVPILAQLAAALSEAGYLVVRYDPRGVGQSGGRPESARLRDYAEDVRDLVRYLRDRRDDTDRDRIATVGHDEGGWIALAAAARERRIGAVALLAAPGVAGEELVLERQRAELTRIAAAPAERRERVALQRRLHAALVRDGSWEGIPDDLRRQADTPWFRSLLRYDPRDSIRRMRQPILVLHGELDREVPAHHAERLAELVRDRGRSTVDVVPVAGVNHLLVPAVTGGVAEYDTLPDKQVAPRVAEALIAWIGNAIP
ncbi:MAG: alpha/beta fold hydrolase [Acidobacteria bacterium]|nr:alpha/beta fold hydrolase [Acidobacteriota bacterium]